MAHSPSHQILARIYGKGRGQAFSPKDFHDLASSETVRATLSRLTSKGTIRRTARGVYDYPEESRILDGPAPPDPDATAQAIARAHGWTIQPEGNTALNLLGLSTQVPAHWQYLSDGPSKTIAWVGGKFVFKHRTNKETSALSPRTAVLVQALKALGEGGVDQPIREQLLRALSLKELVRATREARYATAWVYAIIKELAKAKESQDA